MKLIKPLILASGSPRRQQLLQEMGLEFNVLIPDTEESFPPELPLIEVPVYLARKKVQALKGLPEGSVLLSADTIVAMDGRILDKPANEDMARKILHDLSGKSHYVHSGICMYDQKEYLTRLESTEVFFRNLSDAEIDYYVRHFAPLDKAGAYGIQEWIGMIGIEKIRGSYFNVVGLPVNRVYQLLVEFDLIQW